MVQLPKIFAERMRGMLGEQFADFLRSYEKEPTRALLRNSSVIGETDLIENCDFPVEKIAFLDNGYSFDTEKPGNHPLHHAGAYYVQDPSAMITVSAAPLKEGMKCLDLCASPGGKTVQIAMRIGEKGLLVSNEIAPNRCKLLSGNVERLGFSNVLVSNADAKRIAQWYPSYFDFVLVDAPCSGEGMFRKYPESVSEWNEGTPAFCARRQYGIVSEALKTLAPGGYLLYSTCTFSKEENEDLVEKILEENPDLSLQDVPEQVIKVTSPGIGMEKARRFYPHVAEGEGQFLALLRKADNTGIGEPAFSDGRGFIGSAEFAALEDFMGKTLSEYKDIPLCKYGKQIVAFDYPIPEENIYAAGVSIGTIEKGRLIPHHYLFKAYGKRFMRKLELSPASQEMKKYLSGAEIPCELADGWAVVTTCGIPVGGIKVVDGIAKNHYPKGLRTVK